VCPLCSKNWKYINLNDDKIRIYYNDQVAEFDTDENLIIKIGENFGLDMNKYKVTHNKKYVTEYRGGRYSLCTPDVHIGSNAIGIKCKMESVTKRIFLKYSTTIKELRDEVAKLFNMLKDQVKMIYKGTEIAKDFDNLNIYNLDIQDESEIVVECQISNEYKMEIIDNFMILYPICTGSSSNLISNLVAGKVSWLPYPFVSNTTKQELSCLLSSLYILIKKVNLNDTKITSVINRFEKYMQLYDINNIQIRLAKESLELMLKMSNFSDKNRIILACTFHELIVKIQKESLSEEKTPLLSSNILCNLLLSLNAVEKVNWQYIKKETQVEKTFNIYSPLVLTNSTPPLLTLNDNLNVVVFTGKSKEVSLPIILYDVLTDSEIDVNVAELSRKVADQGDTLMIDDRIYDEGIMVCIDISNSMSNCSDFEEDLMAKEKDDLEAENQFYNILNIKKVVEPEDEDLRELQDTVIWFITHPNFNDWMIDNNSYSSTYIINSIICLEQIDNLEKAKIISKYRDVFIKLLVNQKVKIGQYYYSHIRTESNVVINYKNKPIAEFICPIGHDIMNNPVIAKDGFTYEKENIEKWFLEHSTSPLTNTKISKTLLENKTLKIIINDWKEKNIILTTTDQNQITIKLPVPWNTTTFKYNESSNVWDLVNLVYCVTGYTFNEYNMISNYRGLNKTQLIKNITSDIEVQLINKNMITINITYGFSGFTDKLTVPNTYTSKNVIYAYASSDYHKCQLWSGLKDNGDGIYKGYKLSNENKITNFTDLSFFDKQIPSSVKNYLTRLDVVKKLFNAFINRSIAYSFNTAIGLMSFSNESKLECELTPFYESFRDKMDTLKTNGATALYASLKDAVDKLVVWREADLEKRGQAKLRVICLSDGKDTGLSTMKYQVEKLFKHHGVILDCIVIGSDYDNYIGTISKKTNGYVFGGFTTNPSKIKHAYEIMELETMITSKNRAKSTTYNGFISETSLPPILNPTNSLHTKSVIINKALQRLNDPQLRLHKELTEIMKNPHPCIDVYINDNDIYFWKVVIKGPEGTPYQNGTWLIYVQFPQTYPSVPPIIRFVTPIKHCNINNYGRVCHSILDRNYTPATTILLILQCIYGLLLNPDISDPLDTNLAMMFYEATGQYETQIMEHVNKYAFKTRTQWEKELS